MASPEVRGERKRRMERQPMPDGGITFLYYADTAAAARFYGETLGLPLVQDQGSAQIFRIHGAAFVGVVDGTLSEWPFCQVREVNSVMLTLVVSNVERWFDRLKAQGVELLTDLRRGETNIWSFLLKDPGGYCVEIQQFMDPMLQRVFRGAA